MLAARPPPITARPRRFAIWLHESPDSIDECPVVVFGSESGVHVVARNLAEWFHSVVGLGWDNWSGFIVVAKNPESEPLVREVAAFLSEN
jgi:hypothetical protein